MTPATILVVEDNPITRKIVRFALQAREFQILDAFDGAAAVRLFGSKRVDLVLQDLRLPDMDGFNLLASLRALPRGAEVPILAFSGFLSKLEQARVTAVGFDDVIVKPVEPSRLLQIVRGYLPAPGGASPNPGPGLGEGQSLVVADDDAVQRKLACFRLARLGFDVTGAADGVAALALSRAKRPSAIVSDVMMPGMDGFELCMAVQADPALRATPVVLMTNTYVDPADRELARKAGARALVLRTPELHGVIDALRASLLVGPGPAPIASAPLVELEAERAGRVMKQLDRQVALNTTLSQRCATLSAELLVLSGISAALGRQQDVGHAVSDVLAACFDAGGISSGALLLTGDVAAVHNFSTELGWSKEGLRDFFGEPRLLRAILDGRRTVELPSPGAPEDGAAFLRRACVEAAIVVPLLHGTEALGALLLGSSNPEYNREDRVAFAEGVANQISTALILARTFAEKDASERRAQGQAAVLGTVLESIGDAVIVADATGKVIISNPAAAAIVALHSGVGQLFRDDKGTPVLPGELPHVRAARGEMVDTTELWLRDDGSPDGRWLDVQARPLHDEGHGIRGGVAVYRDVTAEKSTRAQLMASDRMASVGLLAAGVAHEINNPLAAVLANLEFAAETAALLVEQPTTSAELSELVEILREAREGAERVRTIVRDLKLFSRAEEDRVAPTDVRRVLESSIRLAWNEVRHRATVRKTYAETPPVLANEARLGQVFLNLIVNAAQAIPEGKADSNEIAITTSLDSDGRVVVAISDTGAGIPPEVVSRLFTPFFTTKAAGTGTGLGLSICQRLITGIGGEITVESAGVGKGSVFRIVLPPTDPGESEAAPVAPGKQAKPGRRGTILVLDDEKAICVGMARIFGKDHDVQTETSAPAALRRIVGGARFDVILCDLMMPVMTGMEFHAELTSVAPALAERIVFLTGGAFTARARAFLDEVGNPRIEKPFDLARIRALIDQRIREG